jgi:PAS domain S-box-containing protein
VGNILNKQIDTSNQTPFVDDKRHSYDNHSDPINVMNLQGDILYSNQAASNLLGYTMEELLICNFNDIISTESLEIFKYYFEKAATSDIQEFIIGVKCKNGKRLEFKMVTMSNEIEGHVVNITGILTEISDQKNVNLVINQTSKDICQSFIENNRDPILLLDLDATIILANHSFSQLLGWRKENLEGFHILLCPSIPLHMIEQMRDYYHRVINGEPNLSTLETVRMTTEGIPRYMMLSITPIHDLNSNVCNWAVHLRDITAQKEAELSLMQAEKILAFSQLAAHVAQEIRSPLESLKKTIQTTKTREDNELYSDRCLDSLSDKVNRMESFANELSLLSKSQIKL